MNQYMCNSVDPYTGEGEAEGKRRRKDGEAESKRGEEEDEKKE